MHLMDPVSQFCLWMAWLNVFLDYYDASFSKANLIICFPADVTFFYRCSCTECNFILHGVHLPPDAPIQWISENMSYADSFLHIVVHSCAWTKWRFLHIADNHSKTTSDYRSSPRLCKVSSSIAPPRPSSFVLQKLLDTMSFWPKFPANFLVSSLSTLH